MLIGDCNELWVTQEISDLSHQGLDSSERQDEDNQISSRWHYLGNEEACWGSNHGFLCMPQGHKSYECKVKNGGKKKDKRSKQASSPTPTPTRLTRRPLCHTNWRKNGKVVAVKVNKQVNTAGGKQVWVPKILFQTWRVSRRFR